MVELYLFVLNDILVWISLHYKGHMMSFTISIAEPGSLLIAETNYTVKHFQQHAFLQRIDDAQFRW